MTEEKKLEKAMDLLGRAAARLSDETAPDPKWWPDLFAFTGEHMILTEEGWESEDAKQAYLDDWAAHPGYATPILAEVNEPAEGSKS